MTRKQYFSSGLKDGMPICFGYFAVSFAFGIQAAGIGLSVFEASVLSALNVTSAGQFAALAIIASGASLIELAFTQLIINLRYFLMSCALSQKLSPSLPLGHRLGIAYGMTDEIFAVSVSQREPLSPFYSYGLIAVAIPGWVLGTALGAAAGNILPTVLTNALGIAIYGMFIAIILPPAKENRVVAGVVVLSMVLSRASASLSSRLSPQAVQHCCSPSRMSPQNRKRRCRMRVEVFLYILVMAAVTYLIRMLPLTLIRRKITNRTLRSFLYYVPYATLSAMTFPAILTATGSAISAALGFAAALILAFRGKSLLTVAIIASATVLVCELILPYLPL